MDAKYRYTKAACYMVNITMAVVGNLPPLLFLTFHNLYGISYSLLGFFVLVGFVTQLVVDLIFSFFSHRFNIPKTVKFTPILAVVGFAIFMLSPVLFPNNIYAGLLLGVFIFSASSGLAEVLISPVIAAIPADDPESEMSKLHSIYAWGAVFVIIVSTLFILLFGSNNWQWLTGLFLLVPISAAYLYARSEIPPMKTPDRVSGTLKYIKNKSLWLCIVAIFLGGAAECTMAQWASCYLEQALGISKIWGDVFGVALFSFTLALGRTMYSKYGKNIGRVLFIGALGSTLCYLIAAITNINAIGLFACGFTGFCVSMFWPGSLIVAADRFPTGGVFIYAMMAAGGDLGASVGPQLIGVITDAAMGSQRLVSFAQRLAIMPEQLGMKIGMLAGMCFSLVAIPVYLHIYRKQKGDADNAQ